MSEDAPTDGEKDGDVGKKDGDVDEFAGIEAAPPRRSPVVALAVLALGGFLLWHLRADMSYAFVSRTPEDLGEARNIGPQGLADNRYVTIQGQPDRRNALFIEPKGEKSRQSFFRLLGTDTRILVRAADSKGRGKLEDRWSGRLRRFSALAWGDSLRRYYSEEVSAARFIALDVVRAALASHPTSLRDRTGEPLTLTPSTPVHVDALFPDELLVTLSGEKFPAADDAKHELEKLGLKVVSPRKNEGGDFDFVIEAKDKAPVIDKLEKADIGFAAHQERKTVAWADLKSLDEHTNSVSIDAPIHIPGDAWVVTEDEAPANLWWAPVVAALLFAFAAFNVWYLLRARLVRPAKA
jgi:hypothetical protein